MPGSEPVPGGIGIRVGLIVNPVAGLGGPAGLKGSDGARAQARARELGVRPRSQERAVAALRAAGPLPDVRLVTCPGQMGAAAAAQAGWPPDRLEVLPGERASESTAADTRAAARAMARAGCQLIVFAGGDGTASDIAAAIGTSVPILGIPAGVKMHSGCFGYTPQAAGGVLRAAVTSRAVIETRDVLDVDEDALRAGHMTPTLRALARVPVVVGASQGGKSPSGPSQAAGIAAAVTGFLAAAEAGRWLVGPGSTMQAIGDRLGLDLTPLGVDLIELERPAQESGACVRGRLLASDLSEGEILAALHQAPARIVITPIGGQGVLLGRGNQQLSAAVLRHATGLIAVADRAKLAALGTAPLIADVLDGDVHDIVGRHVTVITGVRERSVLRLTTPGAPLEPTPPKE